MTYRIRQLVLFAAAFGAATAAYPAQNIPAGWQTDLRLMLGYYGEGERDLGLGDLDNTNEGYGDVQATAYWNSGLNWAAMFRAEGFAPTDEVTVTDEDQPRESRSFARLREFWVEYNGITSYPGEVLRVGLQRLRDPDGMWFDRNIEAVRWIFDTTLVQTHIGVAESFLTYRSDDSDPPASMRDRTFVFGGAGTQWTAGHFIGARAIHAFDHNVDFQDEQVDDDTRRDPKRSDRNLTWVDLYMHNGYYDTKEQPGWSYWADVSGLFGDRKDFTPAIDLLPEVETDNDVKAWATDVGLRYRMPTTVPVQFGAHYAIGSGSEDGDREHRYEQTGLHSNLSRFTGTRSQVYRFNGALQADLTNLQVATAYLSIPQDRWDASLVYSNFRRQHAGEPIVADGISIQPEGDGKALGDGYDLVVAYYFANPMARNRTPVNAPQEDDDLRSNLRLRASMFDPKAAFPDNADPQYLVKLELTLWF
jgi:alginate production protein